MKLIRSIANEAVQSSSWRLALRIRERHEQSFFPRLMGLLHAVHGVPSVRLRISSRIFCPETVEEQALVVEG